VQLGHAGQGAAAAEDLGQAGIGQAALLAQPQPDRVGVEVQLADAEVSVEGAAGLAVEGAGARAAALAEHQRHLVVEVEVLYPQPDALPTAHAGRGQQADDDRVAALLEAGAGTGGQQSLELLGAQHRRRIVGNRRL
jgi:hypothetical protein